MPPEKIRLAKEIGKLDGEIVGTERKLANPDFVAKAPEEVIEENRERLATAKGRSHDSRRRCGVWSEERRPYSSPCNGGGRVGVTAPQDRAPAVDTLPNPPPCREGD